MVAKDLTAALPGGEASFETTISFIDAASCVDNVIVGVAGMQIQDVTYTIGQAQPADAKLLATGSLPDCPIDYKLEFLNSQTDLWEVYQPDLNAQFYSFVSVFTAGELRIETSDPTLPFTFVRARMTALNKASAAVVGQLSNEFSITFLQSPCASNIVAFGTTPNPTETLTL